MSTKNRGVKYTEEFKRTVVNLYQSGKTYAQIQKEYGVSTSALSNWIRKYSQVRVDDDTILSAQQIKALQKRNAELEEENLILKNDCNLHATLRQRMRAIDALSGQHTIAILCRVLGVNRSTYYKHLRHQPSRREQENVEIRKRILELYARWDKRLDPKKMTLCLAREYCIHISEGRVYRLMKQMRLPRREHPKVCVNLL